MAAIKYVDLTRLTQYDELIKNYVGEADAKAFKTASFDESTRVLSFYKGETATGTADFTVTIPKTDISNLLEKIESGVVGNVVTVGADGTVVDSGVKLEDLATDEELKAVSDKADENAEAIEVLNGDETTVGSVKKAVKDASDAINSKIGEVEDGKTVMGIIQNIQENAYDDTEIKDTIGDLTTLGTTEKGSLVGAVNEVVDSVADAVDGAKVTISTDTTTEGYLKSYTIKQGETVLSTIDIPKDLVVTSGEVVVDPDADHTGTYIKLTSANQEAPIFINVKDLCDVYIAQQNATQVQLVISDTNEISATIVTGSVGTTELADNAVTTAKILDANVTASKLADDVKTLFDEAGAATTAQTNAQTYADNAVKALSDGAVKTNTEAIEALQEKVGDGMEAISSDEISSLFA